MNKKDLKNQLLNYKLNLILIHDTYSENDQFIYNKANVFVEKFNNYTKNKSKRISTSNYKFAEMIVSYSLLQSAITQMYHLFDQYIRLIFNIDYSVQDFKNVIKEIKKYNYNVKENTYFDLVNKYRLLNNAIKHGGIDELEKEYPTFINNDIYNNELGTILDNKLNINNDDVDECCSCLFKYVEEMTNYLENIGYFDK